MVDFAAKMPISILLLMAQLVDVASVKASPKIMTEYSSAKIQWNHCLARIKFGDLAVVDCNNTALANYRSLIDKAVAEVLADQGSEKGEAAKTLHDRSTRETAKRCASRENYEYYGTLDLMERSFCQVEEAERELTGLLKLKR